jgi:hypothetical protein
MIQRSAQLRRLEQAEAYPTQASVWKAPLQTTSQSPSTVTGPSIDRATSQCRDQSKAAKRPGQFSHYHCCRVHTAGCSRSQGCIHSAAQPNPTQPSPASHGIVTRRRSSTRSDHPQPQPLSLSCPLVVCLALRVKAAKSRVVAHNACSQDSGYRLQGGWHTCNLTESPRKLGLVSG